MRPSLLETPADQRYDSNLGSNLPVFLKFVLILRPLRSQRSPMALNRTCFPAPVDSMMPYSFSFETTLLMVLYGMSQFSDMPLIVLAAPDSIRPKTICSFSERIVSPAGRYAESPGSRQGAESTAAGFRA